ncbi:FimB/Mfa2 family fimbrial subunit [Phocaeicola plebeius]|uniref:FimB/Mfa2 family fimbrial subunit n=1 Tax=Phocaeicola plebeius TaxID=310297 RepID=UPI0021AD261E|nr:FimB/Mfa2 family fimbrial subunit [Phocaeicola plebeius]MCR8882661.1 FimB/Mfa2 family fimbrial subunit [Phocaeicola plebeius]MDM8285825.1 FimB/Mfa2 family fimbrial subunit [Phocaeicola plebeius]
MKTTRFYLYITICALFSATFTACDKDIHENDRHGLAVGMEWLEGIEPTDITSPVNLWIYDAEGHEVEAHEFSSPQELASGLFSLPEGDYTLVGVCGLTEPFRYDYENGTRTADMLRVSLADPSASPAHAVGGVAGVRVTDTGVNLRSVIRVAPLLAELAVRINGVPEGASLAVTVRNAATCLYPARRGDDNSYVVPSAEKTDALLPQAVADGGTLSTDARLMPTAQGEACTMLYMVMTFADGSCHEYTAEAPLMLAGKRYELALEYDRMQPHMYITAIGITDWVEGWDINGDVFHPGE